MTKDNVLVPAAFLRMPSIGMGFSSNAQGGASHRGEGGKGSAGAKDTKKNSGEFREGALSSQKGGGIASSQSSALFQVMMGLAKDDGADRDGTREGGDETMIVLFETRQGGTSISAPAKAQQSSPAGLDSQVEQIYEKIISRLESVKRPGPVVSNAPVNFNIPVNAGAQGLSRLEVSFTDAQVTVKLFFPAGEAGQDLMLAAGQLGHLLQGHLPNRRIKILQAVSQSDEAGEKVFVENELLAGQPLIRSRPSAGGA